MRGASGAPITNPDFRVTADPPVRAGNLQPPGADSAGSVAAELDDAVGKWHEPLVMGRDDHHAAGVGDLAQQPQHAADLHVVEVRRRLVRQQQRRVERERPRDRDTLLLTARQLARAVRLPLGEADLGQHLGRAAPSRACAHALGTQRHLDVLGGREARDQVERLEDDADPAPAVVVESAPVELGHLDAVEPHASSLGAENRGQHRQQRRLAAAARAQQHRELSAADVDRQAVDGAHDISAAGVLHHQVAAQKAHRDPAKDRAGSTPTARRRPMKLASTPTSDRDQRQADVGEQRHLDRHRDRRRDRLLDCDGEQRREHRQHDRLEDEPAEQVQRSRRRSP